MTQRALVIIIISYNTLSRLQSKNYKEMHLIISTYQQKHQLTQDKLLQRTYNLNTILMTFAT